jgi:hypothetical protein
MQEGCEEGGAGGSSAAYYAALQNAWIILPEGQFKTG